jgi:hypothetical protein
MITANGEIFEPINVVKKTYLVSKGGKKSGSKIVISNGSILTADEYVIFYNRETGDLVLKPLKNVITQ